MYQKHIPSEFYTELALLVNSEMPLPESLITLEKNLRKRGMRKMVKKLSGSVSGGSSLASAMAEQPNFFPDYYLAIIEAGEKGNLLPEALHEVSRQSRFSERMVEILRTGAMYPVFIFFFGIIIFGYIMVDLVPNFKELCIELTEGKIPTYNIIIFDLAESIKSHLKFFVICCCLLGTFLLFLFFNSLATPLLVYILKILPPYHRVFRQLNMARFCGLWGIMTRQRVPAPNAFNIIADMTGGSFSRALRTAAKECSDGKKIEDILFENKTLSTMIVTAMKHLPAEKQPEEFKKMAMNFEYSAATAATRVGVLLEMIMIILCAIFIASLLVAMFVPFWSIMEYIL